MLSPTRKVFLLGLLLPGVTLGVYTLAALWGLTLAGVNAPWYVGLAIAIAFHTIVSKEK